MAILLMPLACRALELRDVEKPAISVPELPRAWWSTLEAGHWEAVRPRVSLAASASQDDQFATPGERWQWRSNGGVDAQTGDPVPDSALPSESIRQAILSRFANAAAPDSAVSDSAASDSSASEPADGEAGDGGAAASLPLESWQAITEEPTSEQRKLLIWIGKLAPQPPEWLAPELEAIVAGVSHPADSESMRQAALEAWWRVLRKGETNPREALAPIGQMFRDRPALPAEIRAEMVWLLSQEIEIHQLPGSESFLGTRADGRRSTVELRRAVLEASLRKARESTTTVDAPVGILGCQNDPDGTVRALYGRWLAAVDHEAAAEMLASQLRDRDATVREAAAVSLGKLPDGRGRSLLESLAAGEEIDRMYAVRGLSPLGAKRIHQFASDKSFRVRAAAATELAFFPDASSALTLQRFAADPTPAVQDAALSAVQTWPNQFALPICLVVLEQGGLPARARAVSMIRERTGESLAFDVNGSAEARAAAVRRLAGRLEVDLALWNQAHASRSAPVNAPDASAIANLVETWQRAPAGSFEKSAALSALQKLDAGAAETVARHLEDVPIAESAVLIRQLLVSWSPAYRHLLALDAANVEARREAASGLAKYAEAVSLTPLMLRHLEAALADEQDRLVWQFAVQAVMPDGSDAAADIARLAIEQPWPDVRLHGVRYLRRHPVPNRALWLLPVISDPNRNLQLEAIDAIGRCGHPLALDGQPSTADRPALPGLRKLLASADGSLRFAVVQAMCRLQDEQALAELERLFHAPDDRVRRDSLLAAGELGGERFVEILIRTGWTEKNDAVKLAALTSLEKLVPVADRPAGWNDSTGADARMRAWVEWLSNRQDRTANTARD